MKKIAVLGPKGTFSDVACHRYLDSIKEMAEIVFFPTILKTAVEGLELDYAILPFENTLDGYVMETIDAIMKYDYQIIAEVICPISFNFVSYEKELAEIKDIFVQFKTKGQCLNFLQNHDFHIHMTESNIDSLNQLEENKINYGAIIPAHTVNDTYPLVMHGVEDQEHNETRFLVVTTKDIKPNFKKEIKVSLSIYALADRPGILYQILAHFERHNINLTSVMSRPTKKELGNYNFYIEFLIQESDRMKVDLILEDLKKQSDFKIKVLGIYSNI